MAKVQGSRRTPIWFFCWFDASTKGGRMKVKSYTYEKNWTGRYYRQKLLPTHGDYGQAYCKHAKQWLGNHDGNRSFRE
jgi:hypothetical protein